LLEYQKPGSEWVRLVLVSRLVGDQLWDATAQGFKWGGLNVSCLVASATTYVDPGRCIFAVRMQLANATMRSVGY
ncbi:hypothetical protein HK405_002096, partial [Cladochytrium tenue]